MATLKKIKMGFQDQFSLNAGQKYCRMLPLEHSAILLTFIMLPFVVKTFVLSFLEWLFYTGFTAHSISPFLKYLVPHCTSSLEGQIKHVKCTSDKAIFVLFY